MRDIYKTAKKAQTTPVRGRVKAMMAQPRAVAQARKIARQTTGFQSGGTVKPMSHNSELTKWFLEQHGGTQKGKPHSTRKGRIAAGERALWRGVEEFERKRKKRRMGPGAPSRPRPKAGPPAGRPKAPGGIQRRPSPPGGGIPGLPRPRARPPATREYQDPRDRFKKKKKRKKDYIKPGWKRGEDGFRPKRLWVKEHPYEVKKGGVVQKVFLGKLMEKIGLNKGNKQVSATRHDPLDATGQDYKRMRPEPTHQQTVDVFKDKFAGKKKGGKVKRGCANGGTVVMPTVGNDVRVRAYKQGALIHPRPRPTTVLHGRARGVGIAKRGW